MSLLTAEFQRQGNKTFISDQFQGKLEYTVECQDCGYQSTSECKCGVVTLQLR